MTELLIPIHRIKINIFFYFFLERIRITCDRHSCIQYRSASFRLHTLPMCHPISLTSSHPLLCHWKSRMQQLYCSRCNRVLGYGQVTRAASVQVQISVLHTQPARSVVRNSSLKSSNKLRIDSAGVHFFKIHI